MATKSTFNVAGKNGLCTSCYKPIRRGQMEYREISYGRRVRWHPECARKSVLREIPPPFARW